MPSFSSQNYSLSSGIESVDERYDTASMSFTMEPEQNFLDSNIDSIVQSHDDSSMLNSYESSSVEDTQSIADELIDSTDNNLSDVIRNISQNVASIQRSMFISRNNTVVREIEESNNLFQFDLNRFSFAKNTQKEIPTARNCENRESQYQEDENGTL